MTEIAPHITASPDVCHGRAVIAGTRVLVETVLGQLAAGLGVDDVAETYRLSREDVLAALAYAANTIAQDQLRAI